MPTRLTPARASGSEMRPVPQPSSSTAPSAPERDATPERHVAPAERPRVLPVVERRVLVPAFPALASLRAHGLMSSWLRLVRDGELAGDDRTRARQLAEPGEVADERQDPEEDDQLDRVAGAAAAARPSTSATAPAAPSRPPRPSRRSTAARGLRLWSTPSRAAAGRGRRAARSIRRAGSTRTGRSASRYHSPVTIATTRPAMLSTRERDRFAPRERVADAAVQRIRPIFGEPDDVRLRLDAGQARRAGRRCRCRASPRRATAPSGSRSRVRRDRTSADRAR